MSVPVEIQKKVNKIRPLSDSALRLMKVISNPDHSIYDVVRIVENDAVLTANVLRVVNSAAMGLRTKVTTVGRAISYIGDKMIIGMSVGLCASQVYEDPLEGYEGARGILWQHGIRVALAAREIVQYTDKKINTEFAYTAGIMHDIGKSAISSFLAGKTNKMVSETETGERKDYLAAERDIIGTDHCEVGAYLAKHWDLPEPLPAVITYHHAPQEAPEDVRTLVYIVHLADFVAMMGGTGTGSDSFLYKLDEGYKDYIPISIIDLEKIFYQTGMEYEKTVAAMGAAKEGGS